MAAMRMAAIRKTKKFRFLLLSQCHMQKNDSEHKRTTRKENIENKNEAQTNVMTWSLAENLQSAAAVLMPIFTYNKGKLHRDHGRGESYGVLMVGG